MDALLAAPTSHRVLLDNNRVRVLEVVIEPGTREPERTHWAPSVMIIDEPARIRSARAAHCCSSPRHLPGPDPACASAGWNPRARTRSRTLTSTATTRSASNSRNPGAHPEREPPAPGPGPGTKDRKYKDQ